MNLSHIAANVGHLAIPVLGLAFLYHILRARHKHAIGVLVLGGVAVALLTHPGADGHLMTQIGNGVSSLVGQVFA